MDNRMKKLAFPVVANTTGSPGDLMTLFVHYRK
jgi:hypothetical protein